MDSAALKWVDSIVRRSDAWEDLEIISVHCDFSPRNWLAIEGKALPGVIDWEQSRPG
jgi:thiamine kinase-like enzyme